MAASSPWPFQHPSTHETISTIIQRHSTNSTDVREFVLRDQDLSSAKEILDLGCGFGFMSEALACRAAPDARLVGVDAWGSNEAPFLKKVSSTGRSASFECIQVDSRLPWPDQSFDLVVCSYSLYFFMDVLPEVARVLAPRGLFLALAHSENSFVGLLRAAGIAEDGSELLALSRRFSAENGSDVLNRWFGGVRRVDYDNALRFQAPHLDELLTYLRFKLPFLVPGSEPGDDLPPAMAHRARSSLLGLGEVVVEKSDAAFWCRSPLCH